MNDQTFTIDGYVIHVLFYPESELNEASHRGQSLIGNYSVLKHPPHTQPGEYHLHVYDGNNQIFAINKSAFLSNQSRSNPIGFSGKISSWEFFNS